MTEIELMIRVSMLPPHLKAEVSDFVDFLLHKYVDQNQQDKPLQFGMMSGFSATAGGFNESLDQDFPAELFLEKLKTEGTLDE
jgi:hypothetical protein